MWVVVLHVQARQVHRLVTVRDRHDPDDLNQKRVLDELICFCLADFLFFSRQVFNELSVVLIF